MLVLHQQFRGSGCQLGRCDFINFHLSSYYHVALYHRLRLLALLITQGTFADLSPQQVVNNINTVASISASTNNALSQLSTSLTSSDATTIEGVS